MIESVPCTVGSPKASQHPISFWRAESWSRRAFGRGKPGEGGEIIGQSESLNRRLPEWQITETQAVNRGGKSRSVHSVGRDGKLKEGTPRLARDRPQPSAVGFDDRAADR